MVLGLGLAGEAPCERFLLRALRGTKFVYWVMDLYPDVLVVTGVLREKSLLTRLLEALNRFALSRADRAVVLGRCMERRVLAKGIERETSSGSTSGRM